MSAQRLALALDIGGTKTAAAVVAEDGRVLAQRTWPSGAHRGPEAMIAEEIASCRALLAQVGPGRLVGLGIACVGPLDARRGAVVRPPNLPGWDDVPLAGRLGEALGLPAWLENDANAAALGEARYGSGRGCDPLVYLTVSTGIGGGVVAGGEVFRGACGNAAELGHIVVRAGGRRCRCGGRGCLEAYASGTAIAERAQEALARGGPQARASGLARLGRPLTAEDVVAHAQAGDRLARRIWRESLDLLAVGVVSILHAFNPQRLVLGGGVTRAGDALLQPLRERVRAWAMPALAAGVDIVPSALGERAGLLGAAAIAFARAHEEA